MKKSDSRSIKERLLSTRPGTVLLLILLTAIMLRMGFIFIYPDIGEGQLMDSYKYKKVAVHILQGRGFCEYIRKPSAFAPPLYPTFLAGVFALFGENSVVVKVVQAFLGTIVIGMIYLIGALLYNRKTGLLAAGIAAIYPELVVISAYLYTESLYLLFLAPAIYFVIKGFKQEYGMWPWIMSGFFLGLALLTRHILIVFPLFFTVVLLLFKQLRPYFKKVLVLAVVCYAVITPWIVRNYIQFNEFIPIARGARSGIWVGSYLPHNGEFRYSETRKEALKEAGQFDGLIDRDKKLAGKAVHRILQDPVSYAELSVKKLFQYFFKLYESVPSGQPRPVDFKVYAVLAISYYVFLAAALIGIIMSRGKHRMLVPIYSIIAYSGVIHAMTIVTPRYRIPLYPFLAVLAAWGLYSIVVSKGRLFKA